MGAEKCNAVVLRYADYKEADRMLTLFSREEGKLSAAIKGVRKQNSKLRNGAELFSLGEYIFNNKAGRLTVIGYTPMDSFYPIREDLVSLWCATLAVNMVETVSTVQPDHEMFDCLVFTLSQLAYNDAVAPLAVLNTFLMEFSAINGIYPNVNACRHDADKIYYRSGGNGFVCRECANASYIKTDIQSFKVVLNVDIPKEERLEMLKNLDGGQHKVLFKIFTHHISFCLDKNFKAVAFLESIL